MASFVAMLLSTTTTFVCTLAAVLTPASRPVITTRLAVVADKELADTMLSLMDKWVLDEDISKPFESDVTANACMVPIELEWLNAKVCDIEECPAGLPDAFDQVWAQVQQNGEGCVTVNALKAQIQTMV